MHKNHAIDFSSPATPAWLRKLDCYNFDDPNHRARLLNDLRTTPQRRPIPHNAPFPRNFVQREPEMRNIVAALVGPCRAPPVSLTTVLRGAGGFGKTTLAQAVCYDDDDVLACYSDGVLWLTIGEGNRAVEQLLTELLVQLGQTPLSTAPDALFGEWKEALRTRRCLVVLDDVWKTSHARALVMDGTPSAFLLTTRIPRVSSALDAHE